ncbi:hypothetical protein AGABI1DRAFT_115437 [Agaricus bisporus var. burnettii JB137-S8]|uniref:Uncharacterized protein n=1 Tax=Agaricus bisporus var. burnettii (strain JB137-S8 / ATCC MYA-4627 / FGSC 10392) TaxID=597362 RepID=K5X246_AGABU|nr:uncharacterized protein AGABI1DRAFT_115437 [Agaricus bisporus var. burnettii JB137-S8]EKM76987.1 hypothetical protein AGABI1DRAFT_115437 [Agaricus bisporus var. burnettii JB137-S8]
MSYTTNSTGHSMNWCPNYGKFTSEKEAPSDLFLVYPVIQKLSMSSSVVRNSQEDRRRFVL